MRLAIILTILLISSLHVLSQDLQVTIYGYDSCSDQVRQLPSFGLIKDGITYSVSDSSGILYLEEGGKYVLAYIFDEIDTTQLGKVYDLQIDRKVFSDTLTLISIRACLEPTSHPNFIGYCCCGNKCEGEQVEYYSNGNKRIEGCFREGIPRGELKMYYPEGELKQVDRYNKKGYLKNRIFYDESGKIKASEN